MGKKALRGVMEWKEEYGDKLNNEEKEWAEKFYDEYEGGNPGKHGILTSKEQIKEAYRNYNRLYSDAFNVSRMLNKQQEISSDQREIYELAADENDWETTFDQQGEEAAMNTIMDQAVRDIESGQDKRVVLSRFYVKMKRLNKLVQKEKRKQR